MIPPRLHAALDAASAAALLATAAAARPGAPLRGPLGAIGLAVAAYSLATRYRGAPRPGRPIPMDKHRLLDAAQGAACLALAREAETPATRGFLRAYGLFSLGAAAFASPPGPRGIDLPEAAVSARDLAPDLSYLRCGIVNVAFIGPAGAGDRGWFLVDAGIAGSAGAIRGAARRRYGAARPAAILLTHGHFDHVGALEALARDWDVPVYAHKAEHPFLSGRRAYPPAAPEVGGGAMAELSFLFPRHPLDLGGRLRSLPEDGSIPGLSGWRWIATPGHSPGHVSFWNDRSRSLIAGDAVVTAQQESLSGALFPRGRLQGPPAYFTPDWAAAERSVRRIAALQPDLILTGHGPAIQGRAVARALKTLAEDFPRLGLPARSRYIEGGAGAGGLIPKLR